MSRSAGLALMIAAPVLWSSAGVVTRHIQRAEPFEQVFWRSLFAFLFVFVVLLAQRKHPWTAVRAAGWPGLVSGLMWALMFTAFLFALSLTTTANTLVVMAVSPLLTAIFAFLFLKDPLPIRTWIAAGAAAIGIAWMFASQIEGGHLIGMAVASLIPVAAAINVVVLRASAARLDLVPAVMLGGALSCLIAAFFAFPLSATPRDVALLAFLGVFQLGLPCMFLVLASRSLTAPEIALLGLLEVVLGPLWVWLGAGEEPGAATLIGGTIVLAALAANEIRGTSLAAGGVMREIPARDWPAYLERVAREHHAWLATVYRGGRIEAQDQPLVSISADEGIDIRIGSKSIRVERPRALHVEETGEGAVQALEVDDAGGERVTLRFRIAVAPGALDGLAPAERR